MRADDLNGVDIELRDLRSPLVSSQHRSLREAAEARNIRQPTLSRRLHEIEYQLGVVGLGSGRCHAIPDKSHAINILFAPYDVLSQWSTDRTAGQDDLGGNRGICRVVAHNAIQFLWRSDRDLK